MPRPQKTGLDYWPYDVDLQFDPKLIKPKMHYGYLAVDIYTTLLCILYKDKGYYIDYSDPETVIYAVLERMQGKFQPETNIVAGVIEDLVDGELFSAALLNTKNILTSSRAQRTWYSATADRLSVEVRDDYWLLSAEEMGKLSTRHFLYKKYAEKINRSNNPVNQSKNKINRSNNPQSKVKKRIYEDDVCVDDDTCIYYDELNGPYDPTVHIKELFGKSLTLQQKRAVANLCNVYHWQDVRSAIDEAALHPCSSPIGYIRKLLKENSDG